MEPDRTRHLAFGDLAAVWAMLERLRVARDHRRRRRPPGGPTRRRRWGPISPWRSPTGCRSLLQAGVRRTGGQKTAGDRLGEAACGGVGPPPLLGRHGRDQRGAAARDRAAGRGRHGRGLRGGPVGPGVGHDELRHLHRLGATTGPRSPSGVTPSRSAATCAWSGWAWSCPSTAVSRSSPTPIRATAPTSPSSRRLVDELGGPLRAWWRRPGRGRRSHVGLSTPGRTPRTTTSSSRQSPLHFVGSLPPSDHPDLLAVPKSRYRRVDTQRFPGLTAFETTKVVFGQRAAHRGHPLREPARQAVPGFDQTLAKARRQLGGSPPAWPEARPASPGTRSRPRSPPSSSPDGCPGSSPPP